MKLASCDFCPTVEAKPRGDCLTTTIDGRVYDICPECRAKRDMQLQGKGVNAPAQVSWGGLGTGTTLQPPYTITNSACGNTWGVRPPDIPRGTAAGRDQ